jgi:citrate lyase subunit beta / citryl-CoA lyase
VTALPEPGERDPALGPAGTARTLLFVPGNRAERFTKAASTAADLVVIDLEDAVPDDDKAVARAAACDWLDVDARAAVRVNGTSSHHHPLDVEALAGRPGLLAVLVPMAEEPAAVAALHDRLGPGVEIVPMVETALGLTRALDLAGTPGVSRLAFGHLDFAVDIAASPDPGSMLMARCSLVVASRAAGLPGPVDSVTTSLDDGSAAASDAASVRRLGFTGKLCIHPAQVDAVNSAFTPGAEELDWARRVVAAAAAGGIVRVDGQMVDAPVVRRARSVLARADQDW